MSYDIVELVILLQRFPINCTAFKALPTQSLISWHTSHRPKGCTHSQWMEALLHVPSALSLFCLRTCCFSYWSPNRVRQSAFVPPMHPTPQTQHKYHSCQLYMSETPPGPGALSAYHPFFIATAPNTSSYWCKVATTQKCKVLTEGGMDTTIKQCPPGTSYLNLCWVTFPAPAVRSCSPSSKFYLHCGLWQGLFLPFNLLSIVGLDDMA